MISGSERGRMAACSEAEDDAAFPGAAQLAAGDAHYRAGRHAAALAAYRAGLEMAIPAWRCPLRTAPEAAARRDAIRSWLEAALTRAEECKAATLTSHNEAAPDAPTAATPAAAPPPALAAPPSGHRGLGESAAAPCRPATVCVASPPAWGDVVGLADAKTRVRELLLLPLKFPQLFAGASRQPQNAVLLFGPPGCGKSLLARAAAAEAAVPLLVASAPRLAGDDNAAAAAFRLAERAAARSPQRAAVLLLKDLDEFSTPDDATDGVDARRRRAHVDLLVALSGLGAAGRAAATAAEEEEAENPPRSPPRVFVVGTATRPTRIDGAMRRRFPVRVPVPVPDEAARAALLGHCLRREAESARPPRWRHGPPAPVTASEVAAAAARLGGCSARDVCAAVTAAGGAVGGGPGGLSAVLLEATRTCRAVGVAAPHADSVRDCYQFAADYVDS